MLRIILIILLVLIALRIFRNVRRSFQMHNRVKRRSAGTRQQPQEMISCHRCGTYIVKSNAVFNGSHYYCSEACQSQA